MTRNLRATANRFSNLDSVALPATYVVSNKFVILVKAVCSYDSLISAKSVLGMSENSIRTISKRLNRKDGNTDGRSDEDLEKTTTTSSDSIPNTTESLTTTNIQDETMAETTTEIYDVLKTRSDQVTDAGDPRYVYGG